jgi:hypothetical protein
VGARPRRGIRREPQPYRATLIALMLVAFALSGFGAGLVTRTVAGDALSHAGSLPTFTSHTPTQTPTSTSAPAGPTTTPSPIPTVIAQSGFTLQAVSSAKSLSPGQQFTVVVTALASDHITPVAGLPCYMRARADGTPPLFQQWPGPQVTDNDGRATWTLTAPQNTPGAYGFEVVAYGQHSWSYRYEVTIMLTGSNG